ncbi:hypothetical protein BCR44DRAFT_1437159 [Catenaria anguillulae PL171]|uniref:Uncharacterized protein n=1 Tax=Catenaria anguillulae PL171 TaxID=765915 RepID=A0A1Y2HHQ1_9FUNG|nr:hypothetical protein BCR44DRAFT_1437159 [Catenaria anguillulae PL171]
MGVCDQRPTPVPALAQDKTEGVRLCLYAILASSTSASKWRKRKEGYGDEEKGKQSAKWEQVSKLQNMGKSSQEYPKRHKPSTTKHRMPSPARRQK